MIPIIISASRRTDIPARYAGWLAARLREGFVCTRNPMNARQIRRISLRPADVDGLVLWTKNPIPLLPLLPVLEPYPYYIQFTLTPYRTDAEPGLPSKEGALIPAFQRLCEHLGPDRVIWRYDPVFLSRTYPAEFHAEAFAKMAGALRGYTRLCTISFLDFYKSCAAGLKELGVREMTAQDKDTLAELLSGIARENGLRMDACAEDMDFTKHGITPARCIDAGLLGRIAGRPIPAKKDRNQRPLCGCDASVDIGAYNTCPVGCRYCYANHNRKRVEINISRHDENSPFLAGEMEEEA